MADARARLRITTFLYWILLLYIIVALVWWAIMLLHQNAALHQLKEELLYKSTANHHTAAFREKLRTIQNEKKWATAKYVGEGATFLLFIIISAFFIYRSVRRHFRLQLQQQNFMMAITHELKTPISVTRLSLETLLRHTLAEEKKKKLLQSTLQETLRLDTLINNILVLSQLDAGGYQSEKEELDLSSLVGDTVHQFQVRYADRQVVTRIEPGLELQGDAILLKLLVSNLLENANKYTPKQSPVWCTLSRTGDTIQLQVVDEGPGIAGEEKKKVFQKFYRIGSEQTRKTQGTGLGLYLCKKIAAYHRGDISVTDNLPQGSNFTVAFFL
ncbi:ATP-binding protein [Paraflavisolibacter sp. H34]|uniref:sensor histidine kinase n=1 Tax=Huijunlia imazamoxiresistens TaxID=3127457 RepID=UPI00301936F7